MVCSRLNLIKSAFFLLGLLSMQSNCSKNKIPAPGGNNPSGASISSWLTKGDKSALLQKQNDLTFGTVINPYLIIDVDSSQTFQSIDGFGYSLTGGSAYLINRL